MMAARADAVAQRSYVYTFIVCFLIICTKTFTLLLNSQAELLLVAYTCSPDKNY